MKLQDDHGLMDVAIIGMAGRFPGAATIDRFWDNLCRGVEAVKVFTDEELRAAGVPEHVFKNPAYVRARAALDDVASFDARYFGMTTRESELTNPQHRLFLECAVEALADAGYDPETVDGAIGVYAGAGSNAYLGRCYAAGLVASLGSYRATIANDKDYLPTFASYKLNLKGPSIAIQTACSTSLVAVHVACQAIIGGECQIALAGGASIDVECDAAQFYQEGGILAPDGHCRAFDARAQGTVGGSGVGIVVLKSLEAAVRDGDHIYAVVKGSAINNDGSVKLGYTAPSIEGQARAIADAQNAAGVGPESITYVEAHGTGTTLGDPIEVEALLRSGFRGEGPPCALGSVKTNVGHLDVAAGVAGLIKTALAVERGLLPPSLHYERPNPKIPFAGSRLFVNATLAKWETNGLPRRAGVSSFGIGGTNAHVILEEAPPPPPAGAGRGCELICLSAKTPSALTTSAANLARCLKEDRVETLSDVAYTLHVGRPQLPHRLALVARTRDEAAAALEEYCSRLADGREAKHRPVVFMFPGQATQYVGMGRELYERESAFREEVDRCFALAARFSYGDLKSVMFPGPDEAEAAALRLGQTAYAQVAIFVVEYALARLLMAWGIEPEAMIGHSVGEYVAACIAGCLTLEDAIRLIARRARLMQSAPPGAMLAVEASEADAIAALCEGLSLAAVNAPGECVLSGDGAAIERLRRRFERDGVRCHILQASHAFHSAFMDPILEEFARELRRVKLEAPRVPFISNVSGTWAAAGEVQDAQYWVRHLRGTVRFFDGLRELGKDSGRVYVEVGPGRVLSALAMRSLAEGGTVDVVQTMRGRSDARSDTDLLVGAAGSIWERGGAVAWPRFYAGQQRRRVRLPAYPFERQRYWPAAKRPAAPAPAATAPPPISAASVPDRFEDVMTTQLRVMSEQLELLLASRAASVAG